MTLWTTEELCDALSLDPPAKPLNNEIRGLCIDTRTLKEGDLFVALSGRARPEFNDFEDTGRDGHDFVQDAMEKGATGCLVDREIDRLVPNLQCGDTLKGLWDLGRFRRSQLNGTVIAITGSSGKTTLKNFLSQALDCSASEASLNNHIGVPLSLARTPKDTANAIYEIGTNHPGEIQRLAELVRPNVAVVLNVGSAHIGNFPSPSALREEKLSIGEGVKDGGLLIVQDDLKEEAERRFPNLTLKDFGLTESSWLTFTDIGSGNVRLHRGALDISVPIPGGGQHRASTLAATAATLLGIGVSLDCLVNIKTAMPPGRGRQIEIAGLNIVDESYNANPDSMRQCLIHLQQEQCERRIAIVGDMAELGDLTDELHRELVPVLNQLDGVLCVGQTMRSCVYPLLHESIRLGSAGNAEEMLEICIRHLRSGDRVLVKGSKSVFWDLKFVDKLISNLQS